jgi:prolyl-tRNA editing enzyme YbaK/EbsC (Cys-tRNA(Pro) deacylase)
MTVRLSPSAAKVQAALESLGLDAEVVEMRQTTRSAAEAAAAVGCDVGQIAKSLVFKAGDGLRERAVLIITSGANRVDERAVAELLGERLAKADAEFVRRATGFAIGGVPPVGHAESCTILIDEDLLQYAEIWAAAGTPQAVFRLTPADLRRITGGTVARVKPGP